MRTRRPACVFRFLFLEGVADDEDDLAEEIPEGDREDGGPDDVDDLFHAPGLYSGASARRLQTAPPAMRTRLLLAPRSDRRQVI